ncbi:5056_t:CDS:2, partial [Acaulospora colombiana]
MFEPTRRWQRAEAEAPQGGLDWRVRSIVDVRGENQIRKSVSVRVSSSRRDRERGERTEGARLGAPRIGTAGEYKNNCFVFQWNRERRSEKQAVSERNSDAVRYRESGASGDDESLTSVNRELEECGFLFLGAPGTCLSECADHVWLEYVTVTKNSAVGGRVFATEILVLNAFGLRRDTASAPEGFVASKNDDMDTAAKSASRHVVTNVEILFSRCKDEYMVEEISGSTEPGVDVDESTKSTVSQSSTTLHPNPIHK